MRHLAGYPRFFYPLLAFVLVVLCLSGVLLVPHFFEFRLDWDAPFQVSSELRLYSVASHSLFAFLIVFLTGSLATVHMRAGWVRKENRWSGSLLVLIEALLLLSAVIIYYSGDELWSLSASVLHTGLGLLMIFFVLWHIALGYKIHRKRERQKLRL